MLSPFSAFRMGAYSRWALIRGWALTRINTVTKIKGAPGITLQVTADNNYCKLLYILLPICIMITWDLVTQGI